MKLETERLILRPWVDDDAESLFRYASDPDVGPRAGWTPHVSPEYSLEIIRTVFAQPETYAIVLKETQEVIGCVGAIFSSDTPLEAEIGYWLGKPYWGHGLVAEALQPLIDRCFKVLSLSRLRIVHYDGNDQSRRVAEKCGFIYHHTETDKPTPLGDIRTEHYLFLTASEYLKHQNL